MGGPERDVVELPSLAAILVIGDVDQPPCQPGTGCGGIAVEGPLDDAARGNGKAFGTFALRATGCCRIGVLPVVAAYVLRLGASRQWNAAVTATI